MGFIYFSLKWDDIAIRVHVLSSGWRVWCSTLCKVSYSYVCVVMCHLKHM